MQPPAGGADLPELQLVSLSVLQSMQVCHLSAPTVTPVSVNESLSPSPSNCHGCFNKSWTADRRVVVLAFKHSLIIPN